MNGKFVMEVTVPQLQHPLLYERLSACASARERAAVFRALAEAQLRGDHNTAGAPRNQRDTSPIESSLHPASRGAPARPPLTGTTASSSPTATVATTETHATHAIAAEGFEPVRVDDSDSSGDLFGSYLESAAFL
jgi:hypothetical protein